MGRYFNFLQRIAFYESFFTYVFLEVEPKQWAKVINQLLWQVQQKMDSE